MSAVRLYVDEDAEQGVLVAGLRAEKIDVLTALEADMIGRSDLEQLEYACEQQRALYSLNAADFARLHTEYLTAGRSHFGIIVIPRQRYAVGEKIWRLSAFHSSTSSEEMRDHIVFL